MLTKEDGMKYKVLLMAIAIAFCSGTAWADEAHESRMEAEIQKEKISKKINAQNIAANKAAIAAIQLKPGSAGATGAQGLKGDTGLTGAQGPAGNTNAIFWHGGCSSYGMQLGFNQYCTDRVFNDTAGAYITVAPQGSITAKVGGYYRVKYRTLFKGYPGTWHIQTYRVNGVPILHDSMVAQWRSFENRHVMEETLALNAGDVLTVGATCRHCTYKHFPYGIFHDGFGGTLRGASALTVTFEGN